MQKGTQIIYVPSHCEGDYEHKDVEYGFIMKIDNSGKYAFCRYWRDSTTHVLRTTSTSEHTPLANIVVQTPPYSHKGRQIDRIIKDIMFMLDQ